MQGRRNKGGHWQPQFLTDQPAVEGRFFPPHLLLAPPNVLTFLRPCGATFILCNKKALAYYYCSSAWRDRSPERVVTIHKSPAQLYFLFGIFIIPRRCKYANEAGGPPEAKGVTWETKPRPVGCHLFNLSSDMALEKLVTWRPGDHNGVKSLITIRSRN